MDRETSEGDGVPPPCCCCSLRRAERLEGERSTAPELMVASAKSCRRSSFDWRWSSDVRRLATSAGKCPLRVVTLEVLQATTLRPARWSRWPPPSAAEADRAAIAPREILKFMKFNFKFYNSPGTTSRHAVRPRTAVRLYPDIQSNSLINQSINVHLCS